MTAALFLSVPPCAALAQAAAEPPAPAPAPPGAFSPGAGQPSPQMRPLDPLPDLGVAWPTGEDVPLDETIAEGSDTEGAVRYEVSVEGLDPVGLTARFRDLSTLYKQRGEPANLSQLSIMTRRDTDAIDKLLRTEGFYGGQVAVDVQAAAALDQPARVHLQVTPGPRYTFAKIEIDAPAGAPVDLIRRKLGLKVGEPVAAAPVLSAEAALKLALPEEGYPFADVRPADILIDHDRRTASYRLPVDPGPLSRFGSIRVEGRQLVSAGHVTMLARFRHGDVYDARRVEDLRQALTATGLFSGVSLRPERRGKAEDGSEIVDLVVTTEAAPLRTWAATGGYSTTEGFRLEGSWTHRNLLPPQGAVTLRGVAATREQRAAVELHRRNWRRRDQTLAGILEAANEDQDAYEAQAIRAGLRFERETNLLWQKRWTYSLGIELIGSREKDFDLDELENRRRTFLIAAAPGTLGFDGTDNLLDPHRGFRLRGMLSPEASFQSGVFGYARAQVESSGYMPFSGDRGVLAGRIRLGTIVGASRDRIAPTRRFYAGGGGSVRGYGYQDIGPRDPDGDPIGGRSLTEVAAEVRYRAFGNIGVAAFVDAGALYTSAYPRFSSFQYGAGIGGRYYSAFGPIRLDVATPLNPREGDPSIAVYVSIGQAF